MVTYGIIETEGNMSNKYFTSDLHLDHDATIHYNDRPFKNVGEMQDAIIKQLENLPKGSIIYILGDTLNSSNKSRARAILDRFPKHIQYVFIIGNHDYKLRSVFAEYGRVEDILQIKHNGRKLFLIHYPMLEWASGQNGSILVHGHTHGRKKFIGITIDVGWDVFKQPINIDFLIRHVENKRIYQPVHNHNNGKLFSELT